MSSSASSQLPSVKGAVLALYPVHHVTCSFRPSPSTSGTVFPVEVRYPPLPSTMASFSHRSASPRCSSMPRSFMRCMTGA
jgi:hypothetical protein